MRRQFDSEQIKSLGRHLRRMREDRRWSVRRLSEESGLSAAAIRKLESGQADPRLSSVLLLADALGESIDRLVETMRDTIPLVQLTPAARGASAGRTRRALSDRLESARMRGVMVTVEPGEQLDSDTVPAGSACFCYIVEGAVRVTFGDGESKALSAGDALHVADAPPVAWHNPRRKAARFLCVQDVHGYGTDSRQGGAGRLE